MTDKKLEMKFDPLVIDDLGAKLYSTLPPIISELIANGYDACAKKVWVELEGTGEDKKIVVTDNGDGMSFEEVDKKYLKIGRKRREFKKSTESRCGRPPIGKKGLGKLAFFGIAKKAVIETVKDGKKTVFEMDWGKIQNTKDEHPYYPDFSVEKVSDKDGTKITLSNIDRKSNFDLNSLKKSISNYFIFDEDFKVFVKDDSTAFQEIDNEIRYQQEDRGEDFSWIFPEEAIKLGMREKFPFIDQIKGKVILFDKPVKNNLRGVTLFSRRKLVSTPESFPIQGSSHFFQYLTGWLEVDFVDDFKPDVIATNRSSLNWNDENLEPFKKFLEEITNHIHNEWRKLIKERTKEKIKENYDVDISTWKKSNKNNPIIVKSIDKVSKILEDPEHIEEPELLKVLDIILDLAPQYADFVLWRSLHKKITENEIIREKFFQEKYLEATREAVQIYNEEVQNVSGSSLDGCPLMDICFKKDGTALIHLTTRADESEENIELGHQFLSKGVITGFRNPALGHTSLTKAKIVKTFSDRNCLDILSTVSYLFHRLENRKKPN